MNILEALKSERPIKRPEWPGYRMIGESPHGIVRVEDILADDWQVLEETIEITLAQLIEAFKQAQKIQALSEDIVQLAWKELMK